MLKKMSQLVGLAPVFPFAVTSSQSMKNLTSPSYRLSDLVGVVSSAKRYVSKGDVHGMVGPSRFIEDRRNDLFRDPEAIHDLMEELRRRKIPVRKVKIQNALNQNYDDYNSIKEIVNNGLGAGDDTIYVKIEDGFYEVLDTGNGILDKDKSGSLLMPKVSGQGDSVDWNGRFGMGFYTVFKHLKNGNDYVTLETKSSECIKSTKITFFQFSGEIYYQFEELSKDSDFEKTLNNLGKQTGTRVRVFSQDLREDVLHKKVLENFRYIDSKKTLLINGLPIIGRESLKPRIQFQDLEYEFGVKAYENPRGVRGQVVIQIGDYIVEQPITLGRSTGTEKVFIFPKQMGYNLTRTSLEISNIHYKYFKAYVSRLSDISLLNELYELFLHFDKEKPGDVDSFIDLLKVRLADLINEMKEKNSNIRFYPDEDDLHWHMADYSQEEVFFIHLKLYNKEWQKDFESPKEFSKGIDIFNMRNGETIQVFLTKDLKNDVEYFYEHNTRVLYVNQDLYFARDSFIWKVFQIIPGLDFVLFPETMMEGGALQVYTNPQNVTIQPFSSLVKNCYAARANILAEFASLLGYYDLTLDCYKQTVSDHSIKIKKKHTEGGVLFGWVVETKDKKTGYVKANGKTLLKPEWKALSPKMLANGKIIYIAESQFHQTYVLDENGKEIFSTNTWEIYDVDLDIFGNIHFFGINEQKKKAIFSKEGVVLYESQGQLKKVYCSDGKIRFIDSSEKETSILSEQFEIIKRIEGKEIYYAGSEFFAGTNREFLILKVSSNTFQLCSMNGECLSQWESDECYTVRLGQETTGIVLQDKNKKYHVYSIDMKDDGEPNLRVVLSDLDYPIRSTIPLANSRCLFVLESENLDVIDETGKLVFQNILDIHEYGNHNRFEGITAYFDEEITQFFDKNLQPINLPQDALYIHDEYFLPDGRKIYIVENIDSCMTLYFDSCDMLSDRKYNQIEKILMSDGSILLVGLNENGMAHFMTPEGTLLFELRADYFQLQDNGTSMKMYLGVVNPKWKGIIIEDLEAELKKIQSHSFRKRMEYLSEDLKIEQNGLKKMFYAVCNASEIFWEKHKNNLELLKQCSEKIYLEFFECYSDQEWQFPEILEIRWLLLNFRHLLSDSEEQNIFFRKVFRLVKRKKGVKHGVGNEKNIINRANYDILSIYFDPRMGEWDFENENQRGFSSPEYRLENIVSHIRLQFSPAWKSFSHIPEYNDEYDRRSVEFAVSDLNIGQPMSFVRELLQNSIDIQSRIQDRKDKKIEVSMFLDEDGDLNHRFRDYGGMDFENILTLIDPEESTKDTLENMLGGFGVGFYSSLFGSKSVTVQSAEKGSPYLYHLKFTVLRDDLGKIKKVYLQMEREENIHGFYGTEITCKRMAEFPQLEAAKFFENVQDIGRYVNPDIVQVYFEKELLNVEKPFEIFSMTDDVLGKVKIFKGHDPKLVLGPLPVKDIPRDLWYSLPKIIREFYEKEGFYISLDPKIVNASLQRNSVQNENEILERLQKRLPGMLIFGFLELVKSHESIADFYDLPKVYFSSNYANLLVDNKNLNLEEKELIDKVNQKSFDEIDWGLLNEKMHTDKDHDRLQRRLMKILTRIKFIDCPWDAQVKLSIQDIYFMFQLKEAGDRDMHVKFDLLLKNQLLSRHILRLISYAEYLNAKNDEAAEVILNSENKTQDSFTIDNIQLDQDYTLADIHNKDLRRILELNQRIAQSLVDQYNPEIHVDVMLTTRHKILNSKAAIRNCGTKFELLYPANKNIMDRAEFLSRIMAESDDAKKRKNLSWFLIEEVQTITHELTHAITEVGENMDGTHDRKFYNDQRRLLLKLSQGIDFIEIALNSDQ